MTVDPKKQADLVDALRNKAEAAAARNPAIAELRAAAKPLLEEMRRRRQSGGAPFVLASALYPDGKVQFLEPETSGELAGMPSLFASLIPLAKAGQIRAAAVGSFVERPNPANPAVTAEFVQLHYEQLSGLAALSLMPVDLSVLQGGAAGAAGPAVALMGGKVAPRIFTRPA